MNVEVKSPWTKEEFEQKLRDKAKYYHRNHEFHIMMNNGDLIIKTIGHPALDSFFIQLPIVHHDVKLMVPVVVLCLVA